MKIIVAPDSFKGSLEATIICDILEEKAKAIFNDVEVVKLPMADGGEGTLKAVISSLQGEVITTKVKSPDFRSIRASYGIFDGDKAIIEMAQASAITLVNNRDIMKMNTYGTGQLVLDAIQRGAKVIYIGLGGSATNDAGLGFAQALGAIFLDKEGKEITPIPENFSRICKIDATQLHTLVKGIQFIIMSDVKNPLLGRHGATYTFARQKGATENTIVTLESGLRGIAKLFKNQLNKEVSDYEGAGAAGGLGAGILAFCDATIQAGVFTIMNMVSFSEKCADASFVITGEGRMDYQSSYGKVPYGIATLCKEKGIPCHALVGSLGKGYEVMYQHGITSITSCMDDTMDLDYAMHNAKQLCEQASEKLLTSLLK